MKTVIRYGYMTKKLKEIPAAAAELKQAIEPHLGDGYNLRILLEPCGGPSAVMDAVIGLWLFSDEYLGGSIDIPNFDPSTAAETVKKVIGLLARMETDPTAEAQLHEMVAQGIIEPGGIIMR